MYLNVAKVLIGLMALVSSLSFADDKPWVKIDEKRSEYHVSGKFNVLAPASTVWKVLTDYEQYPRFITVAKGSKLLSRSGNDVKVWQQAEASLMIFTVALAVELQIKETPDSQIAFEDTATKDGDFDTYVGSWKIVESPAGTTVDYDLITKPRRYIPTFIAKRLLNDGLERTLTQFRDEILRRVDPSWKPKGIH